MTWLVPIHEDNKVHLGSDGMYACNYVRADKVRGLINFIVSKSYRHETITSVYQITETQFWNEDIFNVSLLKRIGKRVYDKEKN